MNGVVALFSPDPLFNVMMPCNHKTEHVVDDDPIQIHRNEFDDPKRTLLITALDNPMIGAGIKEGDLLAVRNTGVAHSGDLIVASFDGKRMSMVIVRKTPERIMLLPCNPEYKAVEIDENNLDKINIIGVVRSIMPHEIDADTRVRLDTAAMCEQRQKRGQHSSVPSEAKVAKAVHQVIPFLKYNRHWFCVLRALLDCGYYKKLNYTAFVDDLCKWLGNKFPHKPDANDLADICYASFSKPFEEWEFEKSPFSKCKRRFDEYCEVFRKFQELLFA